MNAIEVKQLSKSFQDHLVLENIDLIVEQKEIFGLLGPSGAGKTTLIKALCSQLQYVGSAHVFGMEARDHQGDILKLIGMSLDQDGFYHRLSVWDNLCFFAKLHEVSKERVMEVLKRVLLYEHRKTTVEKLSNGMKQRLSFAAAILHQPKLLFLDEPTNGLDPNTMNEIHDLIKELHASGTTIFLTTHNMEEATKLCDHVALLHEGNIIAYGTIPSLCATHQLYDHICVHTLRHGVIELKNEPASAQFLGELMKTKDIISIHSMEPDLRQVFMEMTKRKENEHEGK